jgi:hypothetical protein
MRLLITFLALASFFSALAHADTEFGKSLARDGLTNAKGGLSGLSAEDELGVSASGSQGNGGRSVNVDFSQILSSEIECPIAQGETGRYQKIQQMVGVCEAASSTQTKLWVCVPNDSSDVMNEECEDGAWLQGLVTRNASSWKALQTGLDVRLTRCDEFSCELEIRKGDSFQGGQDTAESEGQNALTSAKGAAEDIKGMGAYLPDGTTLQAGGNPNTGDYVGEMMAAGTVAACADDVKASIQNGTPVFTCDGKKEVDQFPGGDDECKDIEVCVEETTEQIEYQKKCEASVNYSEAECTVEYETKQCQLENAITQEKCTVELETEHLATLPEYKACFYKTHNFSPTGSINITVPSQYLNQKVFVGWSRKNLTTESWGELNYYIGNLTSRTINMRTYIRSGKKGELTINGSRKYTEHVDPSGKANTTLGVHVCFREDAPGMKYYVGSGFNFCWSNCNRAYEEERPSGYFLPDSIYLREPGTLFSQYPNPTLKDTYLDAGYRMFKGTDTSSYPYQSLHIIYRQNEQRSCELIQ